MSWGYCEGDPSDTSSNWRMGHSSREDALMSSQVHEFRTPECTGKMLKSSDKGMEALIEFAKEWALEHGYKNWHINMIVDIEPCEECEDDES